MTRARGSKVVAAAMGILALLAVPTAAIAGETSPDGWAHRSSVDGSVGTDGWAAGSSEQPVTDGFQASQMRLPQSAGIAHGFEVSHVQLPQSAPVTDGFEKALIALPKPMPVEDGWAVRSELTRRPAPAIDGWSYAALANGPESVPSSPAPAPPRQPSVPSYELVLMALAVVIAGAGGMLTYRRHHIPA